MRPHPVPLEDPTLRALLPGRALESSRLLDLSHGRRIAIVGSRAAPSVATAFAFELASALASRDITIVSGGAVGADAAAHEGALATGGTTWAVLPTAFPAIFPPEHTTLFPRIHDRGGCLIWTAKPGTTHVRANFLLRNGIMVALSEALVVVAAGAKSGARNAAVWARKLRRPVFVVAGPPWMPEYAGGTLEVAHGARPISGKAELLKALLGTRGTRPSAPRFDYLFQYLCNTPLHLDVLTERTGVPVSRVRADLTELLVSGLVAEIDGAYKLSTY